MQSPVSDSTAAEHESPAHDLGPLAWVLDELRKSLESASKALKRFVRDAEAAKGSDLAAIDASQLRIARQQLHQAVGALEMVGMAGPSLLLRSMESAVQKFIQHPEQCSPEAAAHIEKAGFALAEYLEGVLADKPVSSISLFPQYRDVQEIIRAERIHPADLWSMTWRWIDPPIAVTPEPRPIGEDTKKVFDLTVLQLMKGKSKEAAETLTEICLGLSLIEKDYQIRIFWKISAAYFEAITNNLLGSDIYVRRAASRILLQYTSLVKGDKNISERLALDLLFFCSQAVPSQQPNTPVLSAVRASFGLKRFKAVNYELVQFGRFDPALLAQARKRIASAKETWSSLCAGDLNKFKTVVDQFSLVSNSLVKLHPASEPLAVSLTHAIDTASRLAQIPRLELAMEVATSVLYLEAVFEDLDPNDPQLAIRTANLAERLESVRAGGKPQPLEIWMEELYRRVSDKQTMGSVVGELHVGLNELEKLLDNFFRKPQDKSPLQPVIRQLSQMRGVLSVLGLDHGSSAVLHMKTSVESMLLDEFNAEAAHKNGLFDQLGNNLGALAFLIDMLNYQPVLAKKLFVFNVESGELKSLMGRSGSKKNTEILNFENISSSVESSDSDSSQIEFAELVLPFENSTVSSTSEQLSERSNTVDNEHSSVELNAVFPAVDSQSAEISNQILPSTSIDIETSKELLNKQPLKPIVISAEPVIPSLPAQQEALDTSEEDDELLEIFLEEAKEVAGNGLEALSTLAINPGDGGSMTILRRAFHTLKGSSRMVGLDEFGYAAWSLEQLINTWLADQKNATADLCALCTKSIHGFEAWIADIAIRQDKEWKSEPFIRFADNLRLNNIFDPKMDLTRPLTVANSPDNLFVSANVLEQDGESLTNTAPAYLTSPELPTPIQTNDFDINYADINTLPLDMIEVVTDPVGVVISSKDENQPITSAVIATTNNDLNQKTENIDELLQTALIFPSEFSGLQQTNLLTSEITDNLAENEIVFEIESIENITLSDHEASQFFGTDDIKDQIDINDQLKFELPVEIKADLDNIDAGYSTDLISSALDLPGTSTEDLQSDTTTGFLYDSENEQIRVIGSLRIAIPLYNVYLNEADEWSRRLVTEMTEWSLDHAQPINDSSIFLAHSLAGSSATVGFMALSEVARALEHALEQSKIYHGSHASVYANDFVSAAEDIRRLLHQFAAGFLREADRALIDRLKSLNLHELSIAKPADKSSILDLSSELNLPIEFVKEPSITAPAFPVDSAFSAESIIEVNASLDKDATAVADFLPIDLINGSVLENAFSPQVTIADALNTPEPIDESIPDFYQYGGDLMLRLGLVLRQWSARPDNTSATQEVLRILQTIQQSAHKASATTVAQKARGIQAQISSFDSEDTLTAVDIEPLLGRFNAMQRIFDVQRQIHATAAIQSNNFSDEKQAQPVVEFQQSLIIPTNTSSPEINAAELPEPTVEISTASQSDNSESSNVDSQPLLSEPQVDLSDQVSFDPVVESSIPLNLPIAVSSTRVLDEDDEEIDAIDAVDMDLFFIFEEECDELMPQLGAGLRQWSSAPDDRNLRLEVLRVLHTLKGSARLAGALRLGEMTHNMESEIEFLGSDDAANQDFASLLARFDAMQHTYENLRVMVQTPGFDSVAHAAAEEMRKSGHSGSVEFDDGSAVTSQPIEAVAPVFSTVSTAEPLPATEAQQNPGVSQQIEQQNLDDTSTKELPPFIAPALTDKAGDDKSILVPAPQAMMTRPLRQAATATIRVRAQLLDRLVTQAGEVMITRSRLEAELNQLRSSLKDMSGNLDRLRQQLRDIELQAETQMQSRLAQAKEAQAGFDPLEFDRFTRVQELTRMMAESVNDVATVQRTLQRTLEATEDDLIAQARQTRELQRDLLRTRMVEFESISDRLYRVVRQASKDSGKQVKLDLLGGTIEMDRGMLDRLTPAFEHLLRNCVAHGVEEAAVRLEAGKPAVGLITVHLRQAGNDVSVEFSDDGAGLNLPRIREKALSLGMITADQVVSNQEAGDLIFMPGFTTANQITELAGRGIGMDVVRSEIDALGGKIETTTEPGKGTLFKLVLPLTTAVTQVVMIRSGSLSIGVPASIVETVRRLSIKELDQAYLSGEIEVSGEKVPFFWSGALLQTSYRTGEIQAKTTPIVVFRSASKRVAMHVDDVIGNQEVVVKNLGPQLSRLPGLAGMSVLASGAVVLIYNPVALATVYGPQIKVWTTEKEAAVAQAIQTKAAGHGSVKTADNTPTAPLVLVVDDSITVRRVTQRFLQREGFRVVMAADGLQALEKLEGELPSVVLSDIEMPRMDGFDLARNIRADERLKNLPIIMITSRIAEKHREYAKELGVDHYLGKPYSEEILAALVRNYCGIAAVEAV